MDLTPLDNEDWLPIGDKGLRYRRATRPHGVDVLALEVPCVSITFPAIKEYQFVPTSYSDAQVRNFLHAWAYEWERLIDKELEYRTGDDKLA